MTNWTTYKDFIIEKYRSWWVIRNLNGETLRICKTCTECKRRIDEQTV